MAQLDAHPTGDRGMQVRSRHVGNILSWRLEHEIFSTAILSLPLIQEGQLSVSGERMCTILVKRLEDWACQVKVWLGKLTTLDMTPIWLMGCKTSIQTNKNIWAAKWENVPYDVCIQRRLRSASASVQSGQGLRCPK